MVIGLGYYSIRVTQTMVQEMREEHNTGDRRPLITGLRRWDRKRPGKARDVTSPEIP
jgi:hypothetical protein